MDRGRLHWNGWLSTLRLEEVKSALKIFSTLHFILIFPKGEIEIEGRKKPIFEARVFCASFLARGETNEDESSKTKKKKNNTKIRSGRLDAFISSFPILIHPVENDQVNPINHDWESVRKTRNSIIFCFFRSETIIRSDSPPSIDS